jgi:two-component system, chemotaxis family, sensor kinase CheA
MAVDMSFLGFFLDEATDIVAGWEKSCLDYEHTGDHEAAESLYRVAHNLKSGGAAVGLTAFSEFVHHIEDLISKILAGTVGKSPELIRTFLEVHTVFSNWLEQLRSNVDYAPEVSTLKRIHAEVSALLAGGTTAPTEPQVPVSVEPDLAATNVLDTVAPENDTLATEVVKESALPPATAQETARHVDPKPAAGPSTPRGSENIRVAANKLDMLIQMVGELSTQQAIVWHGRQTGQLQSKSCDIAIQLMQKANKDLQGVALSLRMQPLQSLFQRLERATSDLARTQGKKIDVVMDGELVEMDRAVIERITEALMHVIRNAVDHGIETPDAREDGGKKSVATLHLKGAQEPGGILITIADDGRGLNTERILKKAIEKGLANPNNTYTTAEINRFVFLHGFSTAEKLTGVSGRGVGMDIVKTTVESIGGSISVQSTFGKGATFSISLPSTLSIVDAIIIEVDQNRYAVPVQDVREIIDLAGYPVESAGSRGRLVSLRNEIVPVERLSAHLPVMKNTSSSRSTSPSSSGIQPALVIRVGADTLAFQIDRIADQQPVSMRPLPGGLDKISGYTGASILGDGDPCVILNLPSLFRRHLERVGSVASSDGLAPEQVAVDQEGLAQRGESAATRHMVFHLRQHILSAPLASIREILSNIHCAPMLGAPPYIMGWIEVRGEILTLIDLGALMNLPPVATSGPMIVIEIENMTLAMMVDRIESVADLAPDASGASINDIEGVSGRARFRQSVIPVIDLKYVLDRVRQVNGNRSVSSESSLNMLREAQ